MTPAYQLPKKLGFQPLLWLGFKLDACRVLVALRNGSCFDIIEKNLDMVQTQKRKKLKTTYTHIPGTHMSCIFGGQHPKRRPFPIKTRVI